MKNNSVQFAVTREDPLVAIELVKQFSVKRLLMIASGGCCAFSLKSVFPELDIHLLDANVQQIQLVKSKIAVLKEQSNHSERFNINNDDPKGLNVCGNFESLFRGFRLFLYEFVTEHKEVQDFFNGDIAQDNYLAKLRLNPYWTVAFDMFFSDVLLNTMFGPEVTQHAEKNSYPIYFRKAFETGITREDYMNNYFLHHVFLGYYLERHEALPQYLQSPPSNTNFKFINNTLEQVDSFAGYDLIDLSNIFDWMADEAIDTICKKISQQSKIGTIVIFRQLNNQREWFKKFTHGFEYDKPLSNKLHTFSRDLFYNKLCICIKKK